MERKGEEYSFMKMMIFLEFSTVKWSQVKRLREIKIA